MRHLALAIALAGVLSGTVCAGEIPSTGAVAPPGGSHCTGSTTAVEIPGTLVIEEIPTTGMALTIVLTLISIVH